MTARTFALSVDSTLGTKLLPGVLSIVAGSVDVISFLGLGGLFAAHITGNLVVLAAHLVTGRAASLAAILSVPVFIVVLGLTRLVAASLEENRRCPSPAPADAAIVGFGPRPAAPTRRRTGTCCNGGSEAARTAADHRGASRREP